VLRAANLLGQWGVTVKKEPNGPQEWMPESELRDALVPGQLPSALRGRNLFWINIKKFLQHSDSDLPAENYLMHWQSVYQCFLEEDASALRGLSYIAAEDPFARKKEH
jgi:hypothetical protein